MEQEQAVGLFAEDIGGMGLPLSRSVPREGRSHEMASEENGNVGMRKQESLKCLQYPGNMLALYWRLLPSQHPCPSSRNSTKLGSAGPPAIKPYGYIV